MAKRFIRKLALLAKTETTYAVDAVPTGALNAMMATECTIEPIAGGEESRNLLLPYLGNQGIILTGKHVVMDFMIELVGSGTLGTAPAYGPLLVAAGFAEVVSAGVDVQYSPVSSAFTALTLYYNLDGVRHIVLGARVSVSLELTPQRIPHYRFRVMGLLGTITDTALPAVTVTAFQTPIVCNKANTTLSLHGVAPIMESLSIDIANQLEPRLLVNYESIEITDRQPNGRAVIEADALSFKDWFAIAQASTTGAMTLTHGVGAAGRIVEITAPKVQIGRPVQGESQRIANYTLPLSFIPNAGNDEIKITVK